MNPNLPVMHGPDVTPAMLAGLRVELGLTRAEFGRLVALSERSVASWEAGTELKPASLRTITEITRFHAAFKSLLTDASAVPGWLRASNPAFGGCSPLQLIERGEIDRLWRMLYFVESGDPS